MGALKGKLLNRIGKTQGGWTSRIHVVVDAKGRPIRMKVFEGNRNDNLFAKRLLNGKLAIYVIADKAYDTLDIRKFLKNRAYPWIKDVAIFLENITVIDKNGLRKLPISSSPEINDNDLSAWFLQNTNYDLALMKSTFKMAAELADELGLKNEAGHWRKILSEFGGFAITPNNELMFSPTMTYNQSHRHYNPEQHILFLLIWP